MTNEDELGFRIVWDILRRNLYKVRAEDSMRQADPDKSRGIGIVEIWRYIKFADSGTKEELMLSLLQNEYFPKLFLKEAAHNEKHLEEALRTSLEITQYIFSIFQKHLAENDLKILVPPFKDLGD